MYVPERKYIGACAAVVKWDYLLAPERKGLERILGSECKVMEMVKKKYICCMILSVFKDRLIA